ncbi:MAG TPA: hypothetical protein PK760_04685, partial [Flavobacteriales bacterium]|nr:hypothetical protein [Flavobacteriales bacterium]
MKRGFATWSAVALTLCLAAQVDNVPRDMIEQRIEAAADQLGGDNNVDLSGLFQTLADHYNDPIDLNNTDAQELGSMMLLNDLQISSLLQHISRNGKLASLYELQTINGWDVNTINLVRPFVTVRESAQSSTASFKEIFEQGSNEVLVRSTMSIEERKGFMYRKNPFGKEYQDPNGEPLPNFSNAQVLDSLRDNSKVYLGSPFRVYTRYRFRYRQNLSFGFTAEKDEGEEFFKGSNKNGYDFYSGHLFLRNRGRLKALAIGDYSAQFGQGLTFWNGLAFSAKSSYTLNVKRNAYGLTPYTSVNENLYMRGVAATYALAKRWDLTAFLSSKGIDGNITSIGSGMDTLESNIDEIVFSSFQQDGYHRTRSEMDGKHSLQEKIAGAHLQYRASNLS